MPELLLELLSEEIPARMQARAAEDLRRLVCDGLAKAGLAHDGGRAFFTPRRLALVVDGLPAAQADIREERRGPKADAPAKAVEGFLASVGKRLEECERRETPKGTFLFAVIERQGRPTSEVVVDILQDVLWTFPWPKSMRWGSGSGFAWVRPLQSILLLFDGRPVPFHMARGWGKGEAAAAHDSAHRLQAGDATQGHRFMAPARFSVSGFEDYLERLWAGQVILDQEERRNLIVIEAERLAAAAGLTLKPDEGLLDEVTGLVEWPVVLMGAIDQAFMDVPPEVLTTAMRTHQKYFSLLDDKGAMAARFIVVANTETADGGRAVVAGNERVLRARLSDAKFFWDQDRKTPLAARAPALAERIYHARLGTMAAKVERMRGLARDLARFIPGADPDKVDRAARLAKADLSSGMVGEFPELQGIMGRYYARHDGEPREVCEAIAEHYSPLGPSDRCPTAPVSIAVALADKIDGLVGFFGIDEKPTGSKDPFALRRAALGVIRIILENRLRLPLLQAFDFGLTHYNSEDTVLPSGRLAADTAKALLEFAADRLKVHLKEQAVRHDLISAVFAPRGDGAAEDDLVRLLARVEALKDFLASDDGANLLTAFRRASNIVRIEEKKDGRSYDGTAGEELLLQDEERTLFQRLAAVRLRSARMVAEERFADAMAALAELRGPVDAFFERVMVNCEDGKVRENRLRLLSQIRAGLGEVADFSLIEG